MSRSWGARRWVLALIACGTCVLAGAATANAANVSFRLTGGGRSIPRQFFGLSMEYNSVATYQNMGPVFKQAVSLFRSENGAPMILRVGGKSADHVYWDPQGKTNPPKNSWQIGTPWMDNLVDMVKGNNIR
ncbi:MAG TPA: hypothetical protein VG405_12755, partial [Solirubrobacteraceae bacterium]|nr:hypothetical protein [Solirubrobacteraceae bacterium]